MPASDDHGGRVAEETSGAALHRTGTYRYLPAIPAYSSGLAVEPGYEILGLHFDVPRPLSEAFAQLDHECDARDLPYSALAALELRSPTPMSFAEFNEFNDCYRELLARRGLLEQDVNPIARTNVAPVCCAPLEPVMLRAFLVRRSRDQGGRDFVVAGAGELDGPLDPGNILARGDTTTSGLLRKADHVVKEMRARLAALQKDVWSPTLVNVYTWYETPGLRDLLLRDLPAVRSCGYLHWPARPPLLELEFEMDVRRVSEWHVVTSN